MGASDHIVIPFFKREIQPIVNPTALLGFVNNNVFQGDLYDLVSGWDMNSEWKLKKKYNTIICTRCAYFSKDPLDFVERCAASLIDGGRLYVDWFIGEQRKKFKDYRVGWLKNGEHDGQCEIKDAPKQFFWSGIWDESFKLRKEYIAFENSIKEKGYDSLEQAIRDEIPSLLLLEDVKRFFDVEYTMFNTTSPFIQLYTLLKCIKK